MDDKVVATESFEPIGGEFSDIVEAICRTREIIETASKLTDEKAKQLLLDGVKIILGQCIDAIDSRSQTDDAVIEEDD